MGGTRTSKSLFRAMVKQYFCLVGLVLSGYCPSYYKNDDTATGCWTFDTDASSCEISNDACTNLVCTADGQMQASLRPELFGLSHEQAVVEYIEGAAKKLTLNDDSCQLVYNADDKAFQFQQLITACGATVGETVDKESFTFTHTLLAAKQVLPGGIIVTNEVSVNLQCVYSKTIEISSDQYEIKPKPKPKAIVLTINLLTTILDKLVLDKTTENYKKVANLLISQLKNMWKKGGVQPKEIKIEYKLSSQLSGRRRREGGLDFLIAVITIIFPENDDPNYEPSDDTLSDLKNDLIDTIVNLVESGLSSLDESAKDITADKITATTEEQEPEVLTAKGTVVGYGKMDSQFSLKICDSETYGNVVTDIIMGQTLYVRANWQTPIDGIAYFIRDCDYACNEAKDPFIAIVKDACYSSALKVKNTNADGTKLMSQTSNFSLQSFVFETIESKECFITCKVRTCVTHLPCGIPETCPANMDYMKYV